MSNISELNKKWAEGLWFAIEQLVITYDQPDIATYIVEESNLEIDEFRQTLKETGYCVEELTNFLDRIEEDNRQGE